MNKPAPKADMSEFTEHFYPVRICYIATGKGWRRFLKNIAVAEEPYPPNSACVTFFVTNQNEHVAAITVSKKAKGHTSPQVMALLAHELVHVKQHVERTVYAGNLGAGAERLDVEAEAYLISKMMLWIMDAYARLGHGFRG